MSPTVFIFGKYRFYFNSREETRMHVHIQSANGEAKFWLEPLIALSDSYSLKTSELKEIQKIVEDRRNEIIEAWKKHFINKR
ncbi:MAG: DUF4160 domain-containing protein [Deltaproteobacteria bacterium]|nr:DUF4160 domain-containing protein [Deltaproteobacteria bacterium]